MSCGHSFTWMAVIPPSHCPVCGACLHCGSPTVTPYKPYPVYPQPYPRPYYPPFWWQHQITSTTGTNVYDS